MRRFWLLFSQSITVLLALWFVLLTLKPDWAGQVLRRSGPMTVLQAGGPSSPGAAPAPGSLSAAAQTASPAVVSLNTRQREQVRRSPLPWSAPQGQGPDVPEGSGSGVIVSAEGHVLTNHHVIDEADEIEVVLSDGRRSMARVLGTDPETDLALLKIDLPKLPVIVFGQSERLRVGDAVLAIGNPFGVGQTVTAGIVSALGRNQLGLSTFENFIQTDAAINPGNSGGALVDANGHLVGINTAIFSRSGGSLGIGFAIPVSLAQQVLQDLAQHGRVTRGWIGVEPRELSPDQAQGLPAPAGASAQGVLVAGVLQDGPAARAGLRPGDVIAQVNRQPVRNVPELLAQVAALAPGKAAQLQVLRRSGATEIEITPGQRPSPRTMRQAR